MDVKANRDEAIIETLDLAKTLAIGSEERSRAINDAVKLMNADVEDYRAQADVYTADRKLESDAEIRSKQIEAEDVRNARDMELREEQIKVEKRRLKVEIAKFVGFIAASVGMSVYAWKRDDDNHLPPARALTEWIPDFRKIFKF